MFRIILRKREIEREGSTKEEDVENIKMQYKNTFKTIHLSEERSTILLSQVETLNKSNKIISLIVCFEIQLYCYKKKIKYSTIKRTIASFASKLSMNATENSVLMLFSCSKY